MMQRITGFRRVAGLFIMAAFLAAASSGEALAKKVRMVPASFSELAKAVSPSVVNIRTVKIIKGGGRVFRDFHRGPKGGDDPFNDFFKRFYGNERQRDFKQRSLGSGFIIDSAGYIVTNNHVIEGADEITVVLKNEKEYEAKVVGRDPYTDIAVIKVKSENGFPAATLGRSDAISVGEWVVAIGSPFGLEQTVTAGIVSAKGRVIGSGPYDDFIQTDASINPGNSGGPLLNMEGEVIGINTMIIAGGQGLGFAIPIDLASGIIAQLKESGGVTRGWLGVTIQDLKKELSEYYGLDAKAGVFIADVVKGDPADKAGIRSGDIILAIGGKPVASSRELTAMVAGIGVGETVAVKVLRDGKNKTFDVTIGKRPEKLAAAGQPQEEGELGFTTSEVTPELAQRLGIPAGVGVVVTGIDPNGRGAEAGLRAGDLILEINRHRVKTPGQVEEMVAAVEKGKTLSFLIKRKNAGILVIQFEK